MPSEKGSTAPKAKPAAFRVRSKQLVVGGLVLMALAAVALWMLAGLNAGTLRAIGPAMLPRWLAIGLALCGAGIVLSGFRQTGDEANRVPVRGPLVVIIAILLFAFTIRPFGLAFVGPVTLILAGYATAEARLRELVVMGCLLTAFCILLFGDMLNLPIPIFPVRVIENLPFGWSLHFAMRAYSGLLVIIGVLVGVLPWLVGKKSVSKT